MAALNIVATKNAKSSTDSTFRQSGKTFPTNSIVMRVAQKLWPKKTDMVLADKTGASDRLCRYWLENKYNLGADHLAALLRSDEGFQVLDAIIGDARPVWWRSFRRSVRRAELRRQQAILAKAIEENEQGELDI